MLSILKLLLISLSVSLATDPSPEESDLDIISRLINETNDSVSGNVTTLTSLLNQAKTNQQQDI